MVYSVGGPPYPLVVLYYLHRVKKSGRIIRPDFRNFGRIIRFRPDSENPDPVHPYVLHGGFHFPLMCIYKALELKKFFQEIVKSVDTLLVPKLRFQCWATRSFLQNKKRETLFNFGLVRKREFGRLQEL